MTMTLGEAIRTVRGPVGQVELARLLGDKNVDQSRISKWERGQVTPSLKQVAAIEDALGVPHGSILRAAGYVSDPESVRDAILSDPNLRAEFRTILAAAYDTMRSEEDPTYKPDTGRRASDMPAGGGVKAVRTSRARAKI